MRSGTRRNDRKPGSKRAVKMAVNYPPCCIPSRGASLAEILYCGYNRGGDPETVGLNYRGEPCPIWKKLPINIKMKWYVAAFDAKHKLGC